LKSRNNGAGSSVSWVRELEDRQRVALRSARREKNMIERRNSDSEVDSFFENKSDDEDIDRVRRMSSDSIRDGDSDNDRDSNRERDRESFGERDRERDRDSSEGRNDGGNAQTRSTRSAVDKPVSELDFVSQYENEIGSSSRGRDGGDGDEESEGGAIDRALKLLGLDGRRTSSQGSAR
jgi:hypothetical protein